MKQTALKIKDGMPLFWNDNGIPSIGFACLVHMMAFKKVYLTEVRKDKCLA
jgi:hypothetical protein